MGPLMDALMSGFERVQPGAMKGSPWSFTSDTKAFGGLMFELTDIAALTAPPGATDIAPYEHQFHGDMMKAPLLVTVAYREDHPVYLALNKRPDAPLPELLKQFLLFTLSDDGQQIVAAQTGFKPIDLEDAEAQREKIGGFLAPLDPELPHYRARGLVVGGLRSVGSDGMKDLMDQWERAFHVLQPGVGKGELWEHLGTLNGFFALVTDVCDIAPMGRELWPQERAAYRTATGRAAPLEIRVARGGFDTPQRTTAQVVFVNAANPLHDISLAQLAAIFGEPRTITRWGQLGAEGAWADRPITLDVPRLVAPNAMSMQAMVLNGAPWSSDVHERAVGATADAIAGDPGAIGFGGLEDGAAGLKTLAVAPSGGGPAIVATHASVASGRYPLTRYMYIRLNRKPGQAIPPHVREFLLYILSREGQEPIRYSGYFPLTEREAAEERRKLQ